MHSFLWKALVLALVVQWGMAIESGSGVNASSPHHPHHFHGHHDSLFPDVGLAGIFAGAILFSVVFIALCIFIAMESSHHSRHHVID
jgi:hypothetical protein